MIVAMHMRVERLLNRLLDAQQSMAMAAMTEPCADYAEYRHRVGVCAGLRMAVQFLQEEVDDNELDDDGN
jgi:hypothetical protein